jgi:hypothetical protein
MLYRVNTRHHKHMDTTIKRVDAMEGVCRTEGSVEVL